MACVVEVNRCGGACMFLVGFRRGGMREKGMFGPCGPNLDVMDIGE